MCAGRVSGDAGMVLMFRQLVILLHVSEQHRRAD